MKICFISDTHKNILNLNKAIKFLKNLGTKNIIHLGDDYTDVDDAGEENILRVPGVYSDVYKNPHVPNRRIENYVGWKILLSHTVLSHPNDLAEDIKPEGLIQNREVDIVLYGHTHVPGIEKDKNIISINPGHLKDEDKNGYPPTFGYLEITEKELLVRIYALNDYSIFKEKKFRRQKK